MSESAPDSTEPLTEQLLSAKGNHLRYLAWPVVPASILLLQFPVQGFGWLKPEVEVGISLAIITWAVLAVWATRRHPVVWLLQNELRLCGWFWQRHIPLTALQTFTRHVNHDTWGNSGQYSRREAVVFQAGWHRE